MAAGKYSFVIEQGTDFERQFDVSEVFPTLVGYTARAQARETIDSASAIFNLSSPSSGLTIDTSNRIITMTINAATTATYTFSTALWDLEVVSGSSVVTRILEGTVTNSLEVTR